MKIRSRIGAVLTILWGALLFGCASAAESEAERLCQAARSAETASPRRALELMRRLYHEMPTAGTAAAARCIRPLKEKMGRVRVLVTMDEAGDPETIEGCTWAAEAMDVFADVQNPPFRRKWARRLMDRCATAVGRAWTRSPDDLKLMALHAKLVRHIEN